MVKSHIKNDATYDGRNEKRNIYQKTATGVGSTPTKQSDPLYSYVKYLYTETQNHEQDKITKDTKAHEENIPCLSSLLESLYANEEERMNECNKRCRHNTKTHSGIQESNKDSQSGILFVQDVSLQNILPDSHTEQFERESLSKNCKTETKHVTEKLKNEQNNTFSKSHMCRHDIETHPPIANLNIDFQSGSLIVHDVSFKQNILPGSHTKQLERELLSKSYKDETKYVTEQLKNEKNNAVSKSHMSKHDVETHPPILNLDIDLQSRTSDDHGLSSTSDTDSPRQNIPYFFPDSPVKQVKRKTNRRKAKLKSDTSSTETLKRISSRQTGESSIHETPKRIFAKITTGNRKVKRKSQRLTIPSTKLRNISKEFDRKEKSLDYSDLEWFIPESPDKAKQKLRSTPKHSGIKRLVSFLEKSSDKKDESESNRQAESRINKYLKKELSEVDNEKLYKELNFEDYINKLISIQSKEPSTRRTKAFAERTSSRTDFDFNDYCQKIFDLKDKFSKSN